MKTTTRGGLWFLSASYSLMFVDNSITHQLVLLIDAGLLFTISGLVCSYNVIFDKNVQF